jgi:SAM-dependent methyltransferase
VNAFIQQLPATARVLDVGSSTGSFDAGTTEARVFRVDLEARGAGNFANADAAALPFADNMFDVVIANHSLEHFKQLEASIREIGRVVKSDGSLIVTVPDATTLADRLYRWLGRGGGHVNAFTTEDQLRAQIAAVTKLRPTGTTLLHSGYTFLNRHGLARVQKKLLLLGGGSETLLRYFSFAARLCDKHLNTRLSVYGWAYYFGAYTPPDEPPRPNVCIRCGAGHAVESLATRRYRCAHCGAVNIRTTV